MDSSGYNARRFALVLVMFFALQAGLLWLLNGHFDHASTMTSRVEPVSELKACGDRVCR